MFAALDVQVTVVDKRPRPLEFVDQEIVDELIHQMRKHDVTFRCGEGVASIDVSEGPPRRGVIQLESGKHLVADLVLFSVGRIGATEEELTKERVPYETGIARFRGIARGQILGDDSGLFKMIFRRDDGRLLGAHCIGTGATELIHIGQAVLALGAASTTS
jgi:pyruvate/2-oxoglutarate dehydrogenase complex dihydrolipoamide dehydrogenase (E3) component